MISKEEREELNNLLNDDIKNGQSYIQNIKGTSFDVQKLKDIINTLFLFRFGDRYFINELRDRLQEFKTAFDKIKKKNNEKISVPEALATVQDLV